MRSVLSTTLVLAATLGAARSLQTFEQQPQYTEVNPGQTTVLHCKVYNKQGHCSWQKDGFPIGPEQDKYEWAESPDRGDCSIRVIGADLKYDDGSWSCQVTASSFQTQDALKSAPARLVVRVEPKQPQIEYQASQIASGQNLTVRVGAVADVQCRARYGNPPATIKWFLGDKELTHLATQQNQTEPDNVKTFAALSVLRHTFSRQLAGSLLRCVALHQAFDTNSKDTTAKLDIQYPPEVKLLGRPERDVEDGIDNVVLRCQADANPPASVFWRFVSKETGRAETFYVATLELSPITKKNSGTYACEAGNSVGKSDPLTTSLDVKYAPSTPEVRPKRRLSVGLFNSTELSCEADGSPPPSYQWLQRLPVDGDTVYVRGTGPQLSIANVSYANQGQYVCVAINSINGNERRVQSDVINLHVTGPPQIQRQEASARLLVEQGGQATLEAVFCADPPATLVTWHWDGDHLQAGNARGRFTADEVTKGAGEDCYRARLHVRSVRPGDERAYLLQVQNDRGHHRHALSLRVKGPRLLTEPVTMVTVISLVCGCLILLVLVVVLLLFAFRRQKWCFSRKGDFKSTDIESKVSDVGSRASAARQGLGAIPPDALYSGPKRPAPADSRYGAAQHPEDTDGGQSDGNSSRGGIIYADLQLPKTSNNGSMRKHRHPRRPLDGGQSHLATSSRTEPARTEYAEIKFVPKIDERADI